MATFLLLPGAGGASWYWHRVVPLLARAGHEAIAVDFPAADERAGLDAYAEIAIRAASSRDDVVLVAQSMGGFTAPLVAARVPLRALVFANAMIPRPNETAGAWWGNVGSTAARVSAAERGGYSTDFDLATYFLHDLPPDEVKALAAHESDEAKVAFEMPCAFDAWPEIPIHVLIGADDRFFPPDFQERVARERLGPRATIERVPGGHLAALSRPEPTAERLIAIAVSGPVRSHAEPSHR
jgi:pimeloyl-ACP methyl ester carboxylesterase